MENRPRPSVVSLTERAADHIRSIIGNTDTPIAELRIGIKNGGCAGMAYTMEYARERDAFDEVVEAHGVTVLIDAKAVLFLLGTEMDYEVKKLNSGFVFRNPNETSACGCGESVSITPATLPAEIEFERPR
jgi:iron-sulfur cluster assembly protein